MRGRHAMVGARAWAVAAGLAVMAACVRPPTPPAPEEGAALPLTSALAPGELYVGLAFSGGGHRASAFAAGVLEELAATGASANRDGLAGSVRFLAGVSGGAIAAAWFALHGAQGLPAFRTRYLAQHGDMYLPHPPYRRAEVAQAFDGDVDARASLGRALDTLLFRGATFADLPGRAPVLRIVASDISRAVPFIFSPATFAAFCADLRQETLSRATAASAAFPGVFRPVEIRTDRTRCAKASPPGALRALSTPAAGPVLQRLAAARARYAEPEVKGIRLWDGGMTDVFGTSALIAARAETAGIIAPMTPQEAVRVRRILFLAVDASAERSRLYDRAASGGRTLALSLYGLPQRLRETGSDEVDLAQTERAIRATTFDGFDTVEAILTEWRSDLVKWRCSLSRARAAELYGRALPHDWDCRDLAVFADQITTADLPGGLRQAVNAVPTRLHMRADEIDVVTGAGRLATRSSRALVRLVENLQAER